MTMNSMLECEANTLKRLGNYQLPNQFKKIGIGIAVLSFIALFVNKFTADASIYRSICKYGLLIGLLLISISKEKIEDELIAKLRMQSYTFAFIAGVAFSLAMPFVDYFVDVAFQPQKALIKDVGDFQILWILLTVQIFYFAMLKRFHQ